MVQLTTLLVHLAVQRHRHDEAPGCSSTCSGWRAEDPKNVSSSEQQAKHAAPWGWGRSAPLDVAALLPANAGAMLDLHLTLLEYNLRP